MTRHYHPESTVYIRGRSLLPLRSMALDECMTCIHHFGIVQLFTALKILCAPPSHLPTPSRPWQTPMTFNYLPSFAFPRMSYTRNHAVRSLSRLASLTQ